MGKISKTFALFLTLIISMSCLTLLTIEPVNAQATSTPYQYPYPSPAIPDFIVTCTNNSLNLIITNQPFTPSNVTVIINNVNVSQPVSLYYNVQVKGHSDYNWTNIMFSLDWTDINAPPAYPAQSKSNYTVLTYSLGERPIFENFSYASQVDFQVQALVGDFVYQQVFPPINPHFPFPYEWTFYGTFGNWSGTQTITLENGATSASPTPTPTQTVTPSIPEFSVLAILMLFLTATFPALLAYFKKHKRVTIL